MTWLVDDGGIASAKPRDQTSTGGQSHMQVANRFWSEADVTTTN